MTARCKGRIFAQIDAMYGGPSYEPEEEETRRIHTKRHANAKQKHLIY
ncbi:hypothetical protein [Methanosarcina sp. UBA289]|nr:hypothetical protein [Methanosarcina sp. UBA289]